MLLGRWAKNASCTCLYKDTAKLLLCFPKASITIFSVVWYAYNVFRSGTIRTCGRCETDISMAESAHLEPVRFCYYGSVLVLLGRLVKTSLMPSLCTPPSEKWSGEFLGLIPQNW